MTDPTTPTLEQALKALSRQCDGAASRDGVGFSGADVWLNDVADKLGDRRLTERQRFYVRKALPRYRRQFAALGIDIDAVMAADDARPAPTPGATPAAKVLRATTPGRCAKCGGALAVGAEFTWGAERGARVHVECPTPTPPTPPQGPSPEQQAADARRWAEHERFEAEQAAAVPWAQQPARTYEELFEPEVVPATRRAEAGPSVAFLADGGPVSERLAGYQQRDPQLDATDVVDQAIDSGAHVVLKAGTGSGKSFIGLVPAVVRRRPTIYSTVDKGLQEQVYAKDAPFLGSIEPAFQYARLAGLGNYVCELRIAEHDAELATTGERTFRNPVAAEGYAEFRGWLGETADGYLDTAPVPISAALRAEVTVDSDSCLGESCPMAGVCWSRRAKARAREVGERGGVVVVNHALLLRDRQLREQSDDAFGVIPVGDAANPPLVIIDEAHHLEDCATDAFAVELVRGRWAWLTARIEKLTVKHKAVRGSDKEYGARAAEWLDRAVVLERAADAAMEHYRGKISEDPDSTQFALADEWPTLGPLCDDTAKLADDLASYTPDWLDKDQRAQWQKLAVVASKLANGVRDAATPDPDRVRYAELEKREDERQPRVKLIAKPIEVAERLNALLWEPLPTVVAMSATLGLGTDPSPWMRRVGLRRALNLTVASPFPYERHARLIVPSEAKTALLTPPKSGRPQGEHDAYTAAIAESMFAGACKIRGHGGAFFLFTSNRQKNRVADLIGPQLETLGWLVLVQGRGLTRAEMTAQFKAAHAAARPAVIFGVKSFWEGVDVPGDALRLVAIDKAPFNPPSDVVWAARCKRVNEQTRDQWAWWKLLAVPTMTVALEQGFGRLIRTATDTGAVLLLDGRVNTQRWGKDVLAALPPAPVADDLNALDAILGERN